LLVFVFGIAACTVGFDRLSGVTFVASESKRR